MVNNLKSEMNKIKLVNYNGDNSTHLFLLASIFAAVSDVRTICKGFF